MSSASQARQQHVNNKLILAKEGMWPETQLQGRVCNNTLHI